MRGILTVAAFLASAVALCAASAEESSAPKSTDLRDTQDYFDAGGRLIGSVTRIGGVTYFNGPDGRLVGTSETIEGRRVYKTY
jgi:hypothetical protein